jgi:DNA polymerase III delta prime subunit
MQTAAELYQQSPFLQLLVYGPTGSGKTTWAARAPRPLFLLTERQGLASIVAANPDAQVALVKDGAHFAVLLQTLKRGAPVELDGQPAFQIGETIFQTLVVDSITDMQQRRKDQISGGGVMSLKKWGRLRDKTREALHDLRSLPCNFIGLALAKELHQEEGEGRTIPMLQGGIVHAIGQFFSGVAYARRSKIKDGPLQYALEFQLPSRWETKKIPGPYAPNRIVCSLEPGKSTLGSLAKLCNPDMNVPMAQDDGPEHVITQ